MTVQTVTLEMPSGLSSDYVPRALRERAATQSIAEQWRVGIRPKIDGGYA